MLPAMADVALNRDPAVSGRHRSTAFG